MKLLTALACIVAALLVDGAIAGLLRVPKVYNALISTNEKLVPSRAISVSAPVIQPVGLAPAVPLPGPLLVTSPYISVDDEKPNKTEADPKPEKIEEAEKKPGDNKNITAHSIPLVSPFTLPVAYYNSITYYHNLWPYSYSSYSPATFLFTAPFAYPSTFGNLHDYLPPFFPGRKQEGDSKKPKSESSGTKEETDKDSEAIEIR
ncbi:hypothetical protein C0J52_15204 [Blattella germanica]|nr:hypothetical protein C0J52_15204 [Blattella germanica]